MGKNADLLPGTLDMLILKAPRLLLSELSLTAFVSVKPLAAKTLSRFCRAGRDKFAPADCLKIETANAADQSLGSPDRSALPEP